MDGFEIDLKIALFSFAYNSATCSLTLAFTPCSWVVRASDQCAEDHGFLCHWELSMFFCSELVKGDMAA